MNKITFPRVGYDGIERSKKEIEDWYVQNVSEKIIGNLERNLTEGSISTIVANEADEDEIIKRINQLKEPTQLKAILLYTPKEIEENKVHFEIVNRYDGIKKAIADAFNYTKFRQNVLVELAKRLNVKVCPYCNMQYTLFAEKKDGKHKVKQLAKLQFDHFVNKNDYPMFSMSLYNLIPSCAVCNQGKHKGELPLALNPYSNDIYKLFHFEVKEPLPLLMGKKEEDKTKIDLVCNGNNDKCRDDVKTYDNTFHISTLYSRHKDIVQEIYDKTYIASSAENLARLLKTDEKRLSELWYGTYLSEKDIEKRPLTKFIQDIKKQSESIF